MKGVLAAMKVRGMSVYGTSIGSDSGHAMPTPKSGVEHRHRNLGGGGNLRAAVFGVNDGLVSNASLILGVAGASSDARLVLLSGVAGLAAGAFAMAAGEYVSVRSQREMFEYQISLERDELAQYPEAEAQELALIYAAKGLPQREATKLAKQIVADPEHALDTLAREELGLNPAELGSPVGAAASSFFSFAAGAALPLMPFLFASGSRALYAAVGVTCVALFVIGATLSLFTGRSALAFGRSHAPARCIGGCGHVRDRPPVRCRPRLTAAPGAVRPSFSSQRAIGRSRFAIRGSSRARSIASSASRMSAIPSR